MSGTIPSGPRNQVDGSAGHAVLGAKRERKSGKDSNETRVSPYGEQPREVPLPTAMSIHWTQRNSSKSARRKPLAST